MTEQQVARPPEDFATAHTADFRATQNTLLVDKAGRTRGRKHSG